MKKFYIAVIARLKSVQPIVLKCRKLFLRYVRQKIRDPAVHWALYNLVLAFFVTFLTNGVAAAKASLVYTIVTLAAAFAGS